MSVMHMWLKNLGQNFENYNILSFLGLYLSKNWFTYVESNVLSGRHK